MRLFQWTTNSSDWWIFSNCNEILFWEIDLFIMDKKWY